MTRSIPFTASLEKQIMGSVFQMTQKKKARPAATKVAQPVVYDHKYGTDSEATVAGVFFFVVPIMFMVFCVLRVVEQEGYGIVIKSALIGGAILRVIATLWVAHKSNELNRNSVRWIAFSFILPGTALMVIGQKKKIKDPSEWKKHLYHHNRTIPAVKEIVASGNQAWQQAS